MESDSSNNDTANNNSKSKTKLQKHIKLTYKLLCKINVL